VLNEGINGMEIVYPVHVGMRVYFSSYHLWAAEHFVRLAAEVEVVHAGKPRFDIGHRAYVTNSVLSAVAFLEAAINEVFDDVTDNHGYMGALTDECARLLAGLWSGDNGGTVERWPILDKYQVALHCSGREAFSRGSPPYQDAKLLVDLRNELTHARPKTRVSGEMDKLSKALEGRFKPNGLMENSGNPYFPDHCLGVGCANWGVKTARAFADDFFGRMKTKANYQQVNFGSP
jgi:hypothetical protein